MWLKNTTVLVIRLYFFLVINLIIERNELMNRLKVDWVTITEASNWYLGRLESEHCKYETKSAMQFKGYQSEDSSVFEGYAADINFCMYRVSGQHADRLWQRLCHGNATRLDLCVDIVVPDSTIFCDRLNVHRRTLKGTTGFTEKGKAAEKAGWTLSFGSRSSDVYVRVYDKTSESNLSQKNVVRVELELKGRSAKAFFKLMKEHGLDSRIEDLFCSFVSRKLKWDELFLLDTWFSGREDGKYSLELDPGKQLPWSIRMQRAFNSLDRLREECPLLFDDALYTWLFELERDVDAFQIL
jgi:hypothetical protein